jgi:hypothetical protein
MFCRQECGDLLLSKELCYAKADSSDCFSMVTASASPQQDDLLNVEVYHAYQGVRQIQNVMLDPSAFTLIQVISITGRKKDQTYYRGCVHYIGSNAYGGRLQRWGGYSTDKKGIVNGFPGTEYTTCQIKSNEKQKDVTKEVSKLLFGQ